MSAQFPTPAPCHIPAAAFSGWSPAPVLTPADIARQHRTRALRVLYRCEDAVAAAEHVLACRRAMKFAPTMPEPEAAARKAQMIAQAERELADARAALAEAQADVARAQPAPAAEAA